MRNVIKNKAYMLNFCACILCTYIRCFFKKRASD